MNASAGVIDRGAAAATFWDMVRVPQIDVRTGYAGAAPPRHSASCRGICIDAAAIDADLVIYGQLVDGSPFSAAAVAIDDLRKFKCSPDERSEIRDEMPTRISR